MSTAPMHFEDFRVGMRFQGTPREITSADHETFMAVTGDRGAVHRDPEDAGAAGFDGLVTNGPLGIGVLFGQLYDLGIVEPTAIATLDLDWSFSRPILVGEVITTHILITRCRRTSRRQAGIVGRHVSLTGADGSVLQSGTTAMLVQARHETGHDEHAVSTDFGTRAWAERLVPVLAANADFVNSVATFDGSIGLQAGRESVQLRIYKGQVLDVATSTPHGPTFTFCGTDRAWVELATAPRNDLVARAWRDEFWATGDMYEYLRMTKTLAAIWDSVRDLAEGKVSS